jgi:hypothetical protein
MTKACLNKFLISEVVLLLCEFMNTVPNLGGLSGEGRVNALDKDLINLKAVGLKECISTSRCNQLFIS